MLVPELPDEGWQALLAFQQRKLGGQIVELRNGGVISVFDYIGDVLREAAPGAGLLWAWHGNYRTNVFALRLEDLRARFEA